MLLAENARTGDVLHIRSEAFAVQPVATLPASLRPAYPELWEIAVLYGPQDFAIIARR